MHIKKAIEPIAFYEELDKQPVRASQKRVVEMIRFLKECGFQLEAWKRIDKPYWQIICNQWVWHCRSHKEAFNHLYPFYYEEKQREYQRYMQKRAEKIKEEMRKDKNEAKR